MKAYITLFLILLIIFAVQSYNMKKSQREKLEKELNETWGKKAERKYRHDEYARISNYYQRTKTGQDIVVDDITWNDLSMDDLFKAINHTYSSVGEENLYRRLRCLDFNKKNLEKFSRMAETFEKQSDKAKKMQEVYAAIGRTKNVSLYDFIVTVSGLKPKSNIVHYLGILLMTLSIGGLFIVPQYAVILFLIVLSWNIYRYYKEKNDVNSYVVCFEYIISMIRHGEKIKNVLVETDHEVFAEQIEKIEALMEKTKNMKKGMFLIGSAGVDDSIVEMVMQYVRMIFHVDLMKFNLMVKKTSENITYIRELYDIIGDVESAIAVASFRTYLKESYGMYAIPEFRDNGQISCEKIYHPLIPDAMKNSMQPEHSVLLTGSNASGKSTYLKTVALNAILSQTIYTAAAQSFQMPKSEVYSSMALRDDLSSNDSYYMAEIKALKRILDRAAGGHPVLCFIDEVLRGTNTIERIAASSEILKNLRADNVICFAATHDIELTYILEDEYSNYHFEEEVTEEDVRFNYHLNKGRTVTRNAIRLLQTLNYPTEIVKGAYAQVAEFSETGKWKSGKV